MILDYVQIDLSAGQSESEINMDVAVSESSDICFAMLGSTIWPKILVYPTHTCVSN